MPRTYVYFDTYQEICNHVLSGYVKPMRSDLTEEEYETKIDTGELANYGFHYRNYLVADLIGADEKIIEGCYLIRIPGINDASPYEIDKTLPLISIYQIEDGEGLYRVLLDIRSCSEKLIDSGDSATWRYDKNHLPDFFDRRREWRIAPGFEPKTFVKEDPPFTVCTINIYTLNNISVYFWYDSENVTSNNLAFEEKLKNYIQGNLSVLTVKES
jgi:hypothetical protein